MSKHYYEVKNPRNRDDYKRIAFEMRPELSSSELEGLTNYIHERARQGSGREMYLRKVAKTAKLSTIHKYMR